MITTLQDPRWLEWAARVLGVQFRECTWITRLGENLSPAAVVVYSRFSPHNCEMSIATDGRASWASREFLRLAYSYPFEELRLRRITAVVEEDNARSLALCRKLGHVQEGRLKEWFGARDGIVFRMLRSECRWIGEGR